MKKMLLSASIAGMTLTGALAADLPSRKEQLLPPPSPPPMWTGAYAGLNLGGTWSNKNTAFIQEYPMYYQPVLTSSPLYMRLVSEGSSKWVPTNSGSGFIGGAQIGYNYQATSSIVLGAEADAQGIAANDGAVTTGQSFAVDYFSPRLQRMNALGVTNIYSMSKSLDYIGTVRGRVGYLVTPTLLVYATGGFAYGGATVNSFVWQETESGTHDIESHAGHRSTSSLRTGWTVGGGLEWMFLNNWSAKVEYLYYDLGTAFSHLGNHTVYWDGNNVLPGINGGDITTMYGFNGSTRFNGNIVRAGVNYHFNLGSLAPVVAKF